MKKIKLSIEVNIKELGVQLRMSEKQFKTLKTFRVHDEKTNEYLHTSKLVNVDKNGDVMLMINENLFEKETSQ